jgi:hypothetical protein
MYLSKSDKSGRHSNHICQNRIILGRHNNHICQNQIIDDARVTMAFVDNNSYSFIRILHAFVV